MACYGDSFTVLLLLLYCCMQLWRELEFQSDSAASEDTGWAGELIHSPVLDICNSPHCLERPVELAVDAEAVFNLLPFLKEGKQAYKTIMLSVYLCVHVILPFELMIQL
jgi:hypothetical protein